MSPTDTNVETTKSSGVETRPAPPQTSPTQTMRMLTNEYGQLRDRATILGSDVDTGHRAAQSTTLELLARERARAPLPELLTQIFSGFGLGWNEIASLVGVSVQAVRRWRNGEPATGENRLAVARLVAFLELISDIPVHEPASWLEMPLLNGYSMRYIDLYREGRLELLFDLAHLRITPEQAMDEAYPDWRARFRREHEVFRAEDGELSIRRRSSS